MKKRICNMCHKPTSDMKGRCPGCRKLNNMRLISEIKRTDQKAQWLKSLERQLARY